MGTTSPREQIESKMLELKLRRVEIKQERMQRVKQLEKILGKEIIREPIPDYVDHSEDEINPEEIEEDKKEDEEEIVQTKKKNKITKNAKDELEINFEEEEKETEEEQEKKNKDKKRNTQKKKTNKKKSKQ